MMRFILCIAFLWIKPLEAQVKHPKSADIWEFRGTEGSQDSLFVQKNTYNTQGLLLEEHNMISGCFTKYQYDDLNRLRMRIFDCGNNEQADVMKISYSDHLYCEENTHNKYLDQHCDSLNEFGLVISRQGKILGNSKSYSYGEWLSYKGKNLVQKLRIQTEYKESLVSLADSINGSSTINKEYYTHNTFDSIIEIRLESSGLIMQITRFTYDPVSKRKKKEHTEVMEEIVRIKTWDYNDQGLVSTYTEQDPIHKSTLIRTSEYENGILKHIQDNLIRENADTERTDLIYSDGLLQFIRYESNATNYACFYKYKF